MAELYNATGSVRTLVGNWQEETVLKATTGVARCKLTNSAAFGGSIAGSTVQEPTFERVIEHTDRETPGHWKAHSTETYQAPANRSELLSYPKVPACGPRQAQELEKMLRQAKLQQPTQTDEGAAWETTYMAEHQPKTMEGLQVGCKVMRPDGSPANRDPVFLQETGIVPCAGRLMGPPGSHTLVKAPSFGYVRGPAGAPGVLSTIGAISGLTSSSVDPAVPITMYTEAAAKSNYLGTFYGTATLGKGLMNRNDQFTKLMGDVNKAQHLL